MKRAVLFTALVIFLLAGCSSGYYTAEDYNKVLKIDSHIHINSDDGVFEQAAADNNFLLITLNVDHGDSANLRSQYEYAVQSAEKHPGKVFYGPSFLFDTSGMGTTQWYLDINTQLASDIAGGAVTVKIWKNIGMTVRDRKGRFIMADDPVLDDIFNFIEYKNLPVTGHLGEPRNCWLPLDQMTVRSDSNYFARNPQYHMYLHPDYPSYEDQIKARDRLLDKHPNLIFIGAHLGSLEWNVDSLAVRLEKYPNMAVDMSARICHLEYQSAKDRERIRSFIIKYQDRLLYGTDAGYSGSNNPDGFKKGMQETWLHDWKYFTTDDEMTSDKFRGTYTGLKLPKEVVDKIYSGNAINWYRLKI